MRTVLVTGATGAVGVPLVKNLQENGVAVTILARPKHSFDSLQRLFTIPVGILTGDTTEDYCDVRSEAIKNHIGTFDAIIHAAGATKYHEHLREKTTRVNKFGTINALELADKLHVPRFTFISTCYVAGQRLYFGEDETGAIENAHNPYESSKIEAEAEVRKWHGKSIILRLSTVIGHSKTGAITNAGGYAGFVQGFWTIRKRLLNYEQHPFYVGINPSSTLNLVPSEWAVDHIRRATESDLEGTVHLSHPQPVGLKYLFEETFHRLFPLPLTYERLEAERTALYANPDWRKIQEFIMNSIVGYFGPYITHDTTFGHEYVKNIPGYTPPPAIDERVIKAQIDYMVNMLFTKGVHP